MLQSKPGRLFSSPSFSMASLSSLFLSNPRSFLPSHPNPSHQIHLSQRHQIVNFSSNSSRDPNLTINQPPPPEKKKSFAVVSGEIFVSLASRIIQRRNGGEREDPIFAPIGTSEGNSEREPIFWRRRKEGIASLVEDPAEPEVVWEQRPKHVEAERGRAVMTSPGFSFSAAGLLFPYHLGVAEFLIEKSYIKDRTPLAGSSAGAIVCAVIASGASMQEALKATKVLAEDCRQRGTAFRLGAVLRDVLDKFLPNDVHARSNGRIRVAVTQLLWRPRGLLVDMFDSREDLINAVITSSFVPGYLAPRPATMFRNRLCVDGGMTFFMPPTSAAETLLYVHRYYLGGKDHIAIPGVTIHSSNIVSEEARLAFSRQVRICAFPASQLGLQGIGISPDCNPENRATPRQLFSWALEPADDHVLDNLFELGYQDAAVWAKENPVEKIVSDNCQCTENSAGAIASHQGS